MQTPQLSQLGKNADGEMTGITVLQIQITSVVEFMGAKWTEDQVIECGQLAYEEYSWLSLAELKQFALRVKLGRYTSNKNVSPAIFMEFMEQYASEMLYERSIFFGQSKRSEWKEPENPVSDELFAEATDRLKGLIAAEADEGTAQGSESMLARQQLRNEERRKLDEAKKRALESVKDLDPRIAESLKNLKE